MSAERSASPAALELGSELAPLDLELPARAGDAGLTPPAPEELLALVHETLGPATGARCVYARWKPGTSITAGYLLELEQGAARYVTYKRYVGDKAAGLADGFRPDAYAAAHAAPLAPFAALEEQRVVLYAFPCDRELDGIARALDWKRTARRIDRAALFPGWTVRKRASTAAVLRYKPERRAVLRLDVRLRDAAGGRAARQLALRVLTPARARQVAVRRGALEAPGAPRAPRLLEHEDAPGLLVEEWLALAPGRPTGTRGMALAGALLGALHRLPGPAAPAPASAPSPVEALELLARVDGLAAAAAPLLAPGPLAATGWVHGDFHLGQIGLPLADDAPALLDLDELRPGHPVEDLACGLADELARHPTSDAAGLRAALLEAHGAAGGPPIDAAALTAWTARELARRAAGCLRRCERDAPAHARALVERARVCAQDGGLR